MLLKWVHNQCHSKDASHATNKSSRSKITPAIFLSKRQETKTNFYLLSLYLSYN